MYRCSKCGFIFKSKNEPLSVTCPVCRSDEVEEGEMCVVCGAFSDWHFCDHHIMELDKAIADWGLGHGLKRKEVEQAIEEWEARCW